MDRRSVDARSIVGPFQIGYSPGTPRSRSKPVSSTSLQRLGSRCGTGGLPSRVLGARGGRRVPRESGDDRRTAACGPAVGIGRNPLRFCLRMDMQFFFCFRISAVRFACTNGSTRFGNYTQLGNTARDHHPLKNRSQSMIARIEALCARHSWRAMA